MQLRGLSAVNLAIHNAVAYGMLHPGGYELSRSVTLGANMHNLLDKDFGKFRQGDVNGTPMQINGHLQGGASIAGTTPPGRTANAQC